jgi:hypothetical protein
LTGAACALSALASSAAVTTMTRFTASSVSFADIAHLLVGDETQEVRNVTGL